MDVNCSAKVWADDCRGIAKGNEWMDYEQPKLSLTFWDTATLVPVKSVNTKISSKVLWTEICIVGGNANKTIW